MHNSVSVHSRYILYSNSCKLKPDILLKLSLGSIKKRERFGFVSFFGDEKGKTLRTDAWLGCAAPGELANQRPVPGHVITLDQSEARLG